MTTAKFSSPGTADGASDRPGTTPIKATLTPAFEIKSTADDWRDDFLAALAETSNVKGAARKAGVNTAKVYKARRNEPEFAREWQDALAEGYDNLEMDLLHRLREGELEGGKTKARRKFDNAISFRLLTAHRDAVGRQKAIRSNEDEDAILDSIDRKLEAMRQRDKAVQDMLKDNGDTYYVGGGAAEN
ncbi:hypothetical protein HME9302_02216 [Alteripontixanthobacter maritimus]|uniref:Terminase small subunit n=1 Tax=Alteripontixanthobacter maritimus TaxID=2161824 RepID=A0A369QDK2_9SPHN|nr:hypothetical protein [Alteripontixanthobacter maritimus]RDC60999.1 hypothetical protein HME9302_02216 [Alteripontixanthobacter maritimus]